MKTDTIAAIATALSESGISIIRISGSESKEIAEKIFRTSKGNGKVTSFKSHTIHYGYIVDHEEVVDEVMLSVFDAPKTYTTEDTVEINCHGGVLLTQNIMDLILKNGARMAEPGEFTKRAFLNGRIDLSKAEAVMDVIQAKSNIALKASQKQLNGFLEKKVKTMRQKILYEIAFIESALDDPEHISLDGYAERLSETVNTLVQELSEAITSFEEGRLMKEGIQTVIVGKPNAGKSSLMNALVGTERAIVTEIAGTTRDTLEESIRVSGVGLNIVDTAGIHETEDVIEKIGVEKAYASLEDADLVLYVVDASVLMDENDAVIQEKIKDKKCIVLLNKTDLNEVVTKEDFSSLSENQIPIIKTSMLDRSGMSELESAVKKMFFRGEIQSHDEVYITSLRHKEALLDTKKSLELVLRSLEEEMPEDFLSIDLMSAYASLGKIIGEEVEDDLVNEIFSKFCMGK